jgi:hypothetical protein
MIRKKSPRWEEKKDLPDVSAKCKFAEVPDHNPTLRTYSEHPTVSLFALRAILLALQRSHCGRQRNDSG